MLKVTSINGISVRLTAERWAHIVEEHCELAGMREDVLETVFCPDWIFRGSYDEYLAVKELKNGKYMVAVYREINDDGFIITSFLTKRITYLNKKERIWPK